MAASKEHNKKYKTGDATFYRTLMKAFESMDTCKAGGRGYSAIARPNREANIGWRLLITMALGLFAVARV